MEFRTVAKKVMVVDEFPEEIVENIVVRLPVKSIWRFRCVCKDWYKLLKGNSRFVRLHLKHAVELNRFKFMLYSLHPSKKNIYTITYDPSTFSVSSRKRVITSRKNLIDVKYPFKSENTTGVGFWGSCDGLVCLSPGYLARMKQSLLDVVMIWNPSTGEYRKLPPAPIVGKPDYLEYGFGYDQKIDDFKVVCLAGNDDKFWCRTCVYTLGGSNSWGPMKKIPYNLACQELAGRLQEVPDMGRLPVNGVIHWIAFRKSGQVVSKVILSSNFEKQEFAEIQLPNPLDERFHTNLCVLEGSLCLLHMSKLRVDLWELSNYEEENSWTMLFTIDAEKVFGYVGYLIPLRCFKNGKSLLAFDRDGAFNIGLYDSERQTFKPFMVFGGMISYSVCTISMLKAYIRLAKILHTN
ncbi:hypothetical protein C5167_026654 [Papaver somniferum]|uniref:F-box/kelch-repeat protein At3g06240-like n=1 Tax=Papaver somniferum TaxID=3469 RepID=UPI000E6FE2CF|nr:F-box/kelch-repeat protein At3g06240-like [Papaver somniferum]RZC85985.1 hypothetical protein C5167_026654 [Papaver somniferum]